MSLVEAFNHMANSEWRTRKELLKDLESLDARKKILNLIKNDLELKKYLRNCSKGEEELGKRGYDRYIIGRYRTKRLMKK